MKNDFKYILYASLILIVIAAIIIIFVPKKMHSNTCNDFQLEDVLLDINIATNGNFYSIDTKDMSRYIHVDFSANSDYIFSYNILNEEEYLFFARNLTSQDVFKLEDYVKTNNELYPDKNIKIVKNGIYVYAVSSGENTSVVEGIIRSYIYCN